MMLTLTPLQAAWTLWIAWIVSWWLAAFWRARTVARAGAGWEALHLIPTMAGFLLLFWTRPDPDDPSRHVVLSSRLDAVQLWITPEAAGWVLVGVIAAGFLFCWWARITLGRLWSGNITRKSDHRIVDTGPYALVRHPIYTGMITSALGLAAIEGALSGFAGVALITYGFWIKARMEERFLRAALGPAYDAYARRKPMLIPRPWPVRTS